MSVEKGNFLKKNEAKRPVPLGGGHKRGGGPQRGGQGQDRGGGRPRGNQGQRKQGGGPQRGAVSPRRPLVVPNKNPPKQLRVLHNNTNMPK